MIEAGVIVGYVVAWATRKGKRVGRELDADIDLALDAGLQRLHEAVAQRLDAEPALAELEQEASDATVSDLTRRRVELSLEAAAAKDPEFAAALLELTEQVRHSDRGFIVAAPGDHAAAIAGSVDIRASQGSAASFTMGDVSFAPAGGTANP